MKTSVEPDAVAPNVAVPAYCPASTISPSESIPKARVTCNVVNVGLLPTRSVQVPGWGAPGPAEPEHVEAASTKVASVEPSSPAPPSAEPSSLVPAPTDAASGAAPASTTCVPSGSNVLIQMYSPPLPSCADPTTVMLPFDATVTPFSA